jgi:glutathione S-transferase
MQFIIKTLSEQSYMVGDSFTGADILFATMFKMFESSALLPKSAAIEDYVKRCLKRPAYARASAKDSAT